MPAKKKASERVDKRYKTKMVIPGQDKPVWITGKTKKELEDKKRQLRQQLIEGTHMDDRPFAEIVCEWFDTDKRPTIKTVSTLKNWQNAINVHVLPYLDHRQLCRAVRYRDLVKCLEHLRGRNATTISLAHAALVHACHYAVREGLMIRDPSLDLPMPESGAPSIKDAFTDEQTARIFATAASQPFGIMLYLLYYTGLRRGEMLGLQWGDVDFKAKMIHVQRDLDYNADKSSGIVIGDLKTTAADRFVPMPAELERILTPLRGLPHVHIVNIDGRPLSCNDYFYQWGKLMIAAGYAHPKASYLQRAAAAEAEGKHYHAPNPRCDYDFDITAHYFRHNYITACVFAGVAPEVTMRIVGHADYQTTVNIYTHIKAEQTRKAAVQLTGVLRDFDKVDIKLTDAK